MIQMPLIIEKLEGELDKSTIQQLLKLEKQLVHGRWGEKDFHHLGPNTFLAVAKEKKSEGPGELVAMCLGDGAGHLYKIIVDEQWKRRGAARVLLAQYGQYLTQIGIKSIYLEVASSNEAAQRFYLTHGAVMLCLKKNFYTTGEDAHAMEIPLPLKN